MDDPPDPSLFEGQDLACIRAGRPVFQGLSFTMNSGEAMILRGPNGSGKSSLLRLLAGLTKPATGTLSWGDRPVTNDPEKHRLRLHYLGHHDGVKPVLTVRENLTLWTRLRGGELRTVEPALERLGLRAHADLPGRFLSAGQKRRLALCRLLTTQGDLWLLDEPSVGLDRNAFERLVVMLSEHRAEGGRIVLATHDALPQPGSREIDMADLAPTALQEMVW